MPLAMAQHHTDASASKEPQPPHDKRQSNANDKIVNNPAEPKEISQDAALKFKADDATMATFQDSPKNADSHNKKFPLKRQQQLDVASRGSDSV